MRIIRLFLAALTLVGVAAMVVLAPDAAGSTHNVPGTGVALGGMTPYSMVWDTVSQPTFSYSNPQ